jgi:hypothetical protein
VLRSSHLLYWIRAQWLFQLLSLARRKALFAKWEDGGNKRLKREVDYDAEKAKRKEYNAWYKRMKKNEAAADPEKWDEQKRKRKQLDIRYRMNKKFKERAAAEESETGFF